MSTDDFQPEPQAAPDDCLFESILQPEIASILPAPVGKSSPQNLAETEESECGNDHPFRELNVTNFIRQVDALYLYRWLEGPGSNEH